MSQFEYPSWLSSVTTMVLIINYIILLPPSIFFIRQTYRIKHELYIRARKMYTTACCGVFLVAIIIIHPLLLWLYFWLHTITILNIILHIMVLLLGIVPLVCIALRLWLFYYKYKLSEAIFKADRMRAHAERKEELKSTNTPGGNRQSVSPFVATPKHAPINTTESYPDVDTFNLASPDEIIKIESMMANPLQFWIDNRAFLGRGQGCLRIVICFMVFDIIIMSLCAFLQVLVAYAIQSVVYIALLVFIHYHVSQLSPVRDQFLVRKQFATELKIIYFNFILWITCLCIWYFTRTQSRYYNIYDNSSDVYVRILIRFLLDGNMTCTAFLLIITQFAIPLHQLKERMDHLSNRNVLYSSSSVANKADRVQLTQCLTDKEGYYLFMERLMKEYCVENLLFITEVTHMKQKFEDSVIITEPNQNSGLNMQKFTSPKSMDIKAPQLSQIPSDRALGTDTNVDDVVNANKSEPMIEMGVINGKKITISAKMAPATFQTTTSYMEEQQKIQKGNMAIAQLPHTVTIAESMKQNNLFDTVDMIYDNFVVESATHSINISFAARNEITKLVMQHRQTVEAQRLKLQTKLNRVQPGGGLCTELSGMIVDVHIFDDAYLEVMRLLSSSFKRFTRSQEYKVYCSAIGK
eukprot:84740_1